MGGQTGTEANGVKKDEEKIDPRCIVKFRPADDWEGEYGFDWFREGDYEEFFFDKTKGTIIPALYDSQGNMIAQNIKSNSHYKNDNIVGRYFGAYFLCYPIENYRPITNKDLFTYNGTAIYLSRYKTNEVPIFYSKSICLNCRNNNRCRLHPSHEIPWIDKGTTKPYPLDPDTIEYIIPFSLSLELLYYETDSSGRNVSKKYEKRLEENYPVIKIIDTSQKDYFVPTISLFSKNDNKETKGIWGLHEALNIKLLISGKNIDADIRRITLEFECTDGIKRINNINPNPNNKNNQCYYDTIDITLTEDFANQTCDGSIKVYAIFDGIKSLAGKIIVEKCIPKIVNILFIPIPIRITSEVMLYRQDLQKQQESIKRFLHQAHIIPSFATLNYQTDNRITNKEISNIVNKYKHLKEEFGNKIGFEIDNNIVISLNELFDDKYKEYVNWYKVFILSVNGKEGCLGRALDIPSKAAVIFPSPYDSTISHELTHCFGLWHSFSNSSQNTIEKYKTSNIMDYPLNFGFDLITYWKWQWEEINNNAVGKYEKQDSYHV